MFKSFIRRTETERQRRGLSYKTKSRRKKTIREGLRERKKESWGVDWGKLDRQEVVISLKPLISKTQSGSLSLDSFSQAELTNRGSLVKTE